MSYTIVFAPAAFRRSIARACSRRGNGHCRLRSENVTSSMPTTTTSSGVVAWRAWKRRATESFCTPGSRSASWAMTAMAAASMPARSTGTTWAPCARPAARRRWSGARTGGLPPARQVAVAGADDHRSLAVHVADGHRALRHGRSRAGARVRGDPARASDGGDAVRAMRAIPATRVARPQLAPRRLALPHGGGARTGPRRGAPQRGAAQVDIGRAAARGALAHPEHAAVELRGL